MSSCSSLFNATKRIVGLRYVICYGIAWRAMPNDLPPWFAVYQRSQRLLAASVFEAYAQDLKAVLRLAVGRNADSTKAMTEPIAAPCAQLPRSGGVRDMTAPSISAVRSALSEIACSTMLRRRREGDSTPPVGQRPRDRQSERSVPAFPAHSNRHTIRRDAYATLPAGDVRDRRGYRKADESRGRKSAGCPLLGNNWPVPLAQVPLPRSG
jgi:transposase